MCRNHFFFLVLSIFLHGCVSTRTDTLSTGQSLFPGQTLTSREGKFGLGFFRPGNSSSSFVGIWYSNIPIQTVVWVANRNRPVNLSGYNNSRLEMSNGNLYIYVHTERIGIYTGSLNATEAVLLDTGNFVLRNASGIIWQSFDNPTDTWLPGAEIGFHWDTNTESRLVSWRNQDDPGSGDYSLEMEPRGGSELFMKRNGSQILWRTGVWQGGGFVLLPAITNVYNFTFISRDDLGCLRYNVFAESAVSRIVIDYLGRAMNFVWSPSQGEWKLIWAQPSNFCSAYGSCGYNAVCDINVSPACSCLPGFLPRAPPEWASADFSRGCVRERPLQCGNNRNANFTRVQNVRLPSNSELLEVGRPEICEFACSFNCSCSAYAMGSGGCLFFLGDLLDLEILPNSAAGGDLYVRMHSVRQPREGTINVLALALAVPMAVLLVCIVLFYFPWKFIRKDSQGAHQNLLLLDLNSNGSKGSLAGNSSGEGKSSNNDLPIFSFSSIAVATNNFSITNKLGEGGFGPVYKGELLNGQFVAVKRLSRRSGQGLEEFKTETELIAKLQHRNLVGIMGCCIENDEKMLVYEYMPHKSMDSLLFDPNKKQLLDWRRRVQIIEGIAQGLLYLHHYSRFRIVHRDLKASNILLDNEMSPKISDFGMARIFGGNDLQANTNRIVGTYGYMSPEYAMEGLFSIKSDVFAFGVLMLEIISGKRNTGFHGHDSLSLLGHAWKLWENNSILDLVDPTPDIFSSSSSSRSSSSTASSSSSTPLRYIQIGLLCVQESAADRPIMSDVVAMLSNEQTKLASPKRPAFTVGKIVKASSGDDKVDICSANDLTISTIEAR